VAVSKRLRYEVFRRDNFTCRYCGAKPPEAQLRPDHVVPVALGGTDDPSNLATSCEACNSGKTSTTPDAPLVADVSADALRWSRALTEAAVQMRAELAGQVERHEKFDQWWRNWTHGGGKKLPIPRPDDWRSSVDGFLEAGLPLDILGWCMEKAMRNSKVAPDQTWRYMCGIAWRKVTELQEAARSLAGKDNAADDEELNPEVIHGRAELARELLGDVDAEDIPRLYAEARENWQAQTQDQIDIAAAHLAWTELRIDFAWLLCNVCDLLPLIPDEVIGYAVREARARLHDERGPGFSRQDWANRAMSIAEARYTGADALSVDGAPF